MSMIGQCNIQDQREYLQLLSNYVRTAVMKICTVHVLVYRFLALMTSTQPASTHVQCVS